MSSKKQITYRDAGVDIDAGNELVRRISSAAKATRRPEMLSGLGGFAALAQLPKGYEEPVLVTGTDGVGTKLRLAIDHNRHSGIGQDLVAMCVNDVLVTGAEPFLFLDYYATGALDVDAAAKVIEGIAAGCEAAGCALIGGETAEMPGMYAPGDFDLAGFAVGAMERGGSLPKDVTEGDVLLGLASDGVHSNGYSLVRRIVEQSGLAWHADCPWGTGTLGEALLTPTRLYVKGAVKAVRQDAVHALAHITGGGLTENVPRALPDGLRADIDLNAWTLPPVFQWLANEGGMAEAEMLKTFNAGIGMVAICPPDQAEAARGAFEADGHTVFDIGRITQGDGVAYAGHLL